MNLNVKKFSFEEHSGLQLKQLSFKITANREKAQLDHFTIELPHSRLALHPVTMSYRHIKEGNGKGRYQDFTFQGSIEQGTFSFADFIPFYPKSVQNHVLEELPTLAAEAQFSGNLKQILIDQFALYTPDRSMVLEAPLTIRHLENPAQRTIKADIRNLRITPAGLKQLSEWTSNDKIPISPYLQAIGTLEVTGALSYRSQYLKSHLNLHTDLGSLALFGSFSPKRNRSGSAYSRIPTRQTDGTGRAIRRNGFRLIGQGTPALRCLSRPFASRNHRSPVL